jgi:hypothetical protein
MKIVLFLLCSDIRTVSARFRAMFGWRDNHGYEIIQKTLLGAR